MRWDLVFFTFVFFFIIINSYISAEITGESVTGESVTAEVTAQTMNLNITILAKPSLILISPENETYLKTTNLLLNYSVSNEDNMFYNLDGGSNITISSATYFNTTVGTHTLYLYANNSQGARIRSMAFTVNNSLLNISYEEYKTSTKGNSTDFDAYSYEDLQDLSNIILEHTTYGKILFNENINVTEDSEPNDFIVNIDNNTDISLNNIELNSTNLPNFNKPATIWFYNLAFDDPRILKDGVVCSPPACVEESYAGGTLKFNVTGFSVYSVDETPITETVTVTTGGGGGTRKAVPRKFNVNPEQIKTILKQGETTTKNIIITNNDTKKLTFTINNSELKDFIKIDEFSFDLNPGESKIITVDIIARENTIPDLYLGKLIFKSGDTEKPVLILVEVESKEPLFDVEIEIPERFLFLSPGEEFPVIVKIFNLERVGMVDVNVEYQIIDTEGNIRTSKEISLAVETRIDHLENIQIPGETEEGRYILYVKTIYDGKTASASQWFNVRKIPPLRNFIQKYFIIFIVMIIFIIIIFLIIYKNKKRKHVLQKHKRKKK